MLYFDAFATRFLSSSKQITKTLSRMLRVRVAWSQRPRACHPIKTESDIATQAYASSLLRSKGVEMMSETLL